MANPITGLPEDAVVFDTETTGFDPRDGHRIVEIGAVIMRDGLPTRETFHAYVYPDREVPQDSVAVHGLTTRFLADYPPFAEIAPKFLEFVGNLPLIAHNAPFDMKFLNHELEQAHLTPIAKSRFHDTIPVARRRHPGASASLDALCRRYKISLESREKHGALIDSQLLAEVIVEMGGGRQSVLFRDLATGADRQTARRNRTGHRHPVLPIPVTAEDDHRHRELVRQLGEHAIWNAVLASEASA